MSAKETNRCQIKPINIYKVQIKQDVWLATQINRLITLVHIK